MTEKIRKDLTINEKIVILEQYSKLPKMSQRSAAKQLKIPQTLLCKILKKREAFTLRVQQNDNLNYKRIRSGKDSQVESALKLWYSNVREHNGRVNGAMMRRKAEALAKKMGKTGFTATDGWFRRWKTRQNIVYKRTRDEQKEADRSVAETWIQMEWPKIIEKYSPDDIYIADEMGLYYRALPQHTNLFQNKRSKEYKVSKERLTILYCVCMSGKKENLVVIGKNKSTRCFKNVNKLPVVYYANEKAWMTHMIFNEWLLKWDKKLTRNIMLLVDNCTAHCTDLYLKHIKLVFMPSMTSLMQQCNQEIIQEFKAHYRGELLARIIEQIEDKTKLTVNVLTKVTNLLDALHLLVMSWEKVSAETIKNCFNFGRWNVESMKTDQPADMSTSEFETWMRIDENIQVRARLSESEICRLVTKHEADSGCDDEGTITEEECNPPTALQMRKALAILSRGVQYNCNDFKIHYEYEDFINNLLRSNE